MPEPDDEGFDQEEKAHDPSVQLRLAQKREKQMASELESLRQAQAESQGAKRELAMMKAGIDLTSPTGKLFAKAYDGEADIEAITAAASEYGILSPKSDESATAEAQALARMGRVSNSATPPPGAPAQGEEALMAELQGLMGDEVWIPDGTTMQAMDILDRMGGMHIDDVAQLFRKHNMKYLFENPGA